MRCAGSGSWVASSTKTGALPARATCQNLIKLQGDRASLAAANERESIGKKPASQPVTILLPYFERQARRLQIGFWNANATA